MPVILESPNFAPWLHAGGADRLKPAANDLLHAPCLSGNRRSQVPHVRSELVMPLVTIPVDQELVDELAESFRQGPILDDQGRRSLNEVTVDRVDGLRIYINADEHPPPHFHVSFQNEDASFSILDCARLDGVWGRSGAALEQPRARVIFEQFCVTHVRSQDIHRFMPRLISQFENGSTASRGGSQKPRP
jgi:Domain of unknown function (DUF4160)